MLCPKYRNDLLKVSLVAYCQTQHGLAKGRSGRWATSKPFLTKSGPRSCPVEGYSRQAATWTEMKVHFWYRHVQDTMVILEGCNLPHQRCPMYDIMVT